MKSRGPTEHGAVIPDSELMHHAEGRRKGWEESLGLGSNAT